MVASVFVLGGGGHSKVLLDCLLNDTTIAIQGILDIDASLHGTSILGIPIIGSEDEILKHAHPVEVKLVNGIGSIASTDRRTSIFHKFKRAGFSFLSVSHQSAYIARDVTLGEGTQLMAGSIVQPGSRIGDNVLVNTKVSIDHDCIIGDHVHLAPAVTCCGNVTIGEGTHIGSGAVIRQGIKIARKCLIAAGAVVIHDLAEGSKVAGIPARSMAE